MPENGVAGRRAGAAQPLECRSHHAASERCSPAGALDQSGIAAGEGQEHDRLRRQRGAREMRLEAEQLAGRPP
jgi:hypothetical protein